MPLKSAVTDINEVEESQRGFYKEQNGIYVLDAEPVEVEVGGTKRKFGVDDVGTLNATMARQQARIAELQQTMQRYEGIDPGKVKQAFDELETLRSENASVEEKARAMAKSQMDQMAGKFEEQTSAWQNQLKTAESALERALIDNELSKAIISAGGDENTVALLTPHLKERIRMNKNGSEYGYEVVDPMTGGPAVGDATGAPMTIKQLVESSKDHATFALAFPSSGKSGGGTKSSGAHSGNRFPQNRSKFTSEQRSEYLEKHGWEKWVKLPK